MRPILDLVRSLVGHRLDRFSITSTNRCLITDVSNLVQVACDQVRGARGRGQTSRRCETQAPLGGKPPSSATVSVPCMGLFLSSSSFWFVVGSLFGAGKPFFDMSAYHRPTASGRVLDSTHISVNFPDDKTYTGRPTGPQCHQVVEQLELDESPGDPDRDRLERSLDGRWRAGSRHHGAWQFHLDRHVGAEASDGGWDGRQRFGYLGDLSRRQDLFGRSATTRDDPLVRQLGWTESDTKTTRSPRFRTLPIRNKATTRRLPMALLQQQLGTMHAESHGCRLVNLDQSTADCGGGMPCPISRTLIWLRWRASYVGRVVIS